MTNIQDKDFRKRLIDKYLEAKTSLAEEQELARFYLQASTIDEVTRLLCNVRLEWLKIKLIPSTAKLVDPAGGVTLVGALRRIRRSLTLPDRSSTM